MKMVSKGRVLCGEAWKSDAREMRGDAEMSKDEPESAKAKQGDEQQWRSVSLSGGEQLR